MPAPNEWMTTARQAAPRLLSLLGELKPTFHLQDITFLDRAFLAKHAVSALLWDVDGTLMPYHDRLVAPELEGALAALRGHVPQAILSNCDDTRLLELGAIFEDIPVLKAYAVDGRIVMRRLERGHGRRQCAACREARDGATAKIAHPCFSLGGDTITRVRPTSNRTDHQGNAHPMLAPPHGRNEKLRSWRTPAKNGVKVSRRMQPAPGTV